MPSNHHNFATAKMSICCLHQHRQPTQHAVSIANGSLLVLACTCLHPAKRTRAPTRLVGNTVIARPACDTAAVAARHTVLRAMRLGGASYRTTPSCCSPHRPVAAGLCTQLSPRGHNTPRLTPSSSHHHTTVLLVCARCAPSRGHVPCRRGCLPRRPRRTSSGRAASPRCPCVGVVCFLGSRARASAAVAGLAARRAP